MVIEIGTELTRDVIGIKYPNIHTRRVKYYSNKCILNIDSNIKTHSAHSIYL